MKMNKQQDSYEDESPLSYDSYAARQRLEDYKRRREDFGLDEKPVDHEAETFFEAVLWVCAATIAVFVGLLVLAWWP